VHDWGHVKSAVNCRRLLNLRDIFRSWETESYRTKCCAMWQIDEFWNSSTCIYEKVFTVCVTTWPKHKLPSNILSTDVFCNIANTLKMAQCNK